MEDIANKIQQYCKKYNIPIQYLVEILEDQKVVPMIRGKASEYNGTLFLQEHFRNSIDWVVTKFNLNPQPDMNDQDLTIIHRKTAIQIRVEVKNATRDSFKDGVRCRDCKIPHLTIKCHKSRSNIKKVDTTNDRYLLGEFDLIMSNTSNSIIVSGTKTLEDFAITDNEKYLSVLYKYYRVDNKQDLIERCYNDWRFADPEDIVMSDGSIPHNPIVLLDASKDTNWFTANRLEEKLLEIVKRKQLQMRANRRR
jgi:hypothetical protein